VLQKIFKIAMSNELGLATYASPVSIQQRVKEWLIVTRSASGEMLTISDAGRITGSPASAPDDLVPENTMFGLLLREDRDKATFLLLRHLPLNVIVAGRFFPVDGYATIDLSSGNIRLQASGRHAHSEGAIDGQKVLYDVPLPAPGSGMAWHFDAKQVPWSAQGGI
jgi:hypothetical protein